MSKRANIVFAQHRTRTAQQPTAANLRKILSNTVGQIARYAVKSALDAIQIFGMRQPYIYS